MNKKFLIIAISISIFIFILVLVFSPRRSSTPSPTPNSQPPTTTRTELIDLSKEKRNETMIYVSSIEKKLPLYLPAFETSVGITTSINIYRAGGDEAEVVRLEIYGLSYMNPDANETKNPNVTAFKESYAKAIEMLEGQNIDPKKLIFIYGDKEYVRTTSQTWIDALKLHP